MTAHTPGPWDWKTRPDIGDGLIATVSVGRKIVSAEGVSASELDANARLIAKAPEMLEALRLALKDHEDRMRFDANDEGRPYRLKVMGIIRDLIKQIEGE